MKRIVPTTPAEIARATADDFSRAASRTCSRAGEHERTAEFAVKKAEEAVRRVHFTATKAAASRAKADVAWTAWLEANAEAEALEEKRAEDYLAGQERLEVETSQDWS